MYTVPYTYVYVYRWVSIRETSHETI